MLDGNVQDLVPLLKQWQDLEDRWPLIDDQ